MWFTYRMLNPIYSKGLVSTGDHLLNWNSGSSRLLANWLRLRSRILGGKFRISTEDLSISGAQVYSTQEKNGETRYFTSLRQASFYSLGLDHRSDALAKSYAIDRVAFDSGDIVIDCGANYGDLHLFLNRIPVEKPITYIGVEPGREEFACLKMNVGHLPGVTLIDKALGEINGIQTFYYDPVPANSSLVSPGPHAERYEVNVQTLDSLVDELGISCRPIKLFKLEAEGFEPEILKGGEKTLSRIEYVAADLGFERGLLSESTAPDVVNFLLDKNFELHAMGSLGDLRMLFRNRSIR